MSMPARLSETAALALVREHCEEFRCRSSELLWFADPKIEHAGGPSDCRSWLQFRLDNPNRTFKTGTTYGTVARLALDLLNVLCACDSFAPSENPRFWRRVLVYLWCVDEETDVQVPQLDDDMAFAHYRVLLPEFARYDLMSTDLHDFLLGESTRRSSAVVDATRRRLDDQLGPFIVRPVRRLVLWVCLHTWNIPHVTYAPHEVPDPGLGHQRIMDAFFQCVTVLHAREQSVADGDSVCGLQRPLSTIHLSVRCRLDAAFHDMVPYLQD